MSWKVFVQVFTVFVLVAIGYSCKSTNNVSSEKLIQKRKYRSGFYVNNPKKTTKPVNEISISRTDLDSPISKPEKIEDIDNSGVSLSSLNDNSNESQSKTDKLIITNNDLKVKKNSTDRIKDQIKNEGLFIEDPPPKKKIEILGVIGFLLVIIGYILLFTTAGFWGIFLLSAAVILSILSLIRIRGSNGRLKGKGFAVSTLVLAGVFLVFLVVFLSILLVGGL